MRALNRQRLPDNYRGATTAEGAAALPLAWHMCAVRVSAHID